jgi:hypothetical protein
MRLLNFGFQRAVRAAAAQAEPRAAKERAA